MLREAVAGKTINDGPTILLGWELGGGFGHAGALLTLARALATHGCRPVFAWRDVTQPWALVRDTSFPLFQAPYWHPRPSPQLFRAAGFADVLAVNGYDSADNLRPLVEAWQSLLDHVRPSLVVCDHAPTLCLAAYGMVPTVLLGSGFWVPPMTESRFPPLVLNQTPTMTEEQVLDVVREVQRQRERPIPPTLPALFAAADRFVTCLPEIDPYRASRREPQLGPMEPLPALVPLPERPSFFAYLSADYDSIEVVLDQLAAPGYPGTVYLRSASVGQRQRWRRPGLTILDEPARLTDVIRSATVMVHHSSAFMAQFALSAGRPQLLFPRHLEQTLTAARLHALGVAHYLKHQYPAADISEGLRQLATGEPFHERAQQLAQSIFARGPWNSLEHITQRCLTLLADPR